LRVVDREHPANRSFLLVSQFSVTRALYTRPPRQPKMVEDGAGGKANGNLEH
jgi:hypothetical protein